MTFVFCVLAAGCATAPPQPPPPLEFAGALDLSQPGIGFRLAHASGLSCDGHYSGSRLPEAFSIPLRCNDERDGVMDAVKRQSIQATIKLADGRTGLAAFELPVKPPLAAKPPPTVKPISRPSGSKGCGSRGGPGYRLPSGKCASWRNRR